MDSSQSWFDREREPLTKCTAAALREHAVLNRGSLAPFRLPQLAQQLISGLVDFAREKGSQAATAHGEYFGQQGLALGSLQAAGRRLIREASAEQTGTALIIIIYDYLSLVGTGLVEAASKELGEQRDNIQRVLETALRSREEELRRLILELSTPIMPIHDGVLVLPLIGEINGERANKITERLLQAITEQRARIAIIDITGVPHMDMEVAAGLLRAARAVQLLGATVLLVGIGADIARTLTNLQVDMTGLTTLANLRSGIEYALGQQGLRVQRIARGPGPDESNNLRHNPTRTRMENKA